MLRAAVVLAALVSLIVAVSPALGAFPGRNGALLISASAEEGDWCAPDGPPRVIARIADEPDCEEAPPYASYLAGPGRKLVRWLDGDVWSAGTFTATGASVLVSHFSHGDDTLFMASALPGARPISLHRRGFAASLSADGRRIALARNVRTDTGASTRIFVAPAAGGAPRLLGDGRWKFDGGPNPRWSSQGRLAYTSQRWSTESEEIVRVMVADVHARRARRVADGVFQDWAPSGRRLLVSRTTVSARTEMERWALYAIGADGRPARRLTTFEYDMTLGSAVWSPDGRKIAFRLNDGAIYTISARSRSPQGPHAWHKIITSAAALHDWQPVR